MERKDKEKTRVAVLMSTYNGEKYLREQIDSILAQEGDFHLDLIVRDDGSKDSTRDILEDYARRGLLTWQAGENMGFSWSFMELARTTSGYDLYAYSDQDDVWLPEKIEAARQALHGIDTPALYQSNAEKVDAKLNSLGKLFNPSWGGVNRYTASISAGLVGCLMVYNDAMATLFRDYPLLENRISHDSYTGTVCAAVGGRFVYDPAPRIKYRRHGGNHTAFNMRRETTIHRILYYLRKSFLPSTQPPEKRLDNVTRHIVETYRDLIPQDFLPWLIMITRCGTSRLCRIRVALSPRIHIHSLASSIRFRLQILTLH